MNIRRNLYESLSSREEVDLDALFQEIWFTKSVQSTSQKINEWQTKQITWKFHLLSERDRTLNFYYRQAQWSFDPHFESISKCIKYYIENGYSKVWNNYRIISRHPHTQTLWNDESLYKELIEFRSMSAIYADTIHLTHGSPELQIPWSHFILWEAITRDTNTENDWNLNFPCKMNKICQHQYTELDLDYFWGNVWYFISQELKNGLWIPDIPITEICKRVILSLLQAEEKIMKNSKSPNQRVCELLDMK
jgi:hypothetical protein